MLLEVWLVKEGTPLAHLLVPSAADPGREKKGMKSWSMSLEI